MKKTKGQSGLAAALRLVVRRSGALAAGLLAVILADILLALVPPLVLGRAVDALTAGRTPGLTLALWYFAALALAGLADAGMAALITIFGQKITHGLRSTLCRKLSRLPADYTVSHETGRTASLFVNDVDAVGVLFDEGIISMFADACKIVSILVVIFTRSVGLGLLLCAVLPLLFWLTRAFQKRMLAAQLANRAVVARVNNHIPETIRCMRTIRQLARQQYMERRYDRHIQDSYASMEKSNLYDSIYSPIIVFSGAAVVAVMMVFSAMGGAAQAFFGMTVGSAVALIAYVGKIFSPLESIGMEIENIQSAVAGTRRIDDFLQQPERALPDLPAPPPSADGASAAIALDGVDFSYRPGEPILKQFSLRVAPGENVTLAGRTGAGKSTVFRLILGLYAPQAGSVRVFGSDAARIRDADKRRLFGYVEQSFRPVPGSVADQISLGDPSLSFAEVETAAKLVGLGEAIARLPQGYDTPCRANLFSQGQFQLLSIARAVAADPAILLLDEITASLDSGTEKLVLEALDRACAHRTVLSISHRLYERGGSRLVLVE